MAVALHTLCRVAIKVIHLLGLGARYILSGIGLD